MTLVVDPTVGGASSNSYVTRANADSYFEGRAFSSAWTGAASGDKDQALVHATSILETVAWKGAKGATPAAALTQALSWPRRWAPTLEASATPEFITEEFVDLAVTYFSGTAIPQPIARATYEIALELLRAGTTDPMTKDTSRNVKRESIGSGAIDTEYVDIGQRVYGIGQFPTAVQLVRPLLRSTGLEVDRG